MTTATLGRRRPAAVAALLFGTICASSVAGQVTDYPAMWAETIRQSQRALPEGEDAWPVVQRAFAEYRRLQAATRIVVSIEHSEPMMVDVASFVIPPADESAAGAYTLVEQSVQVLEQSTIPALLEQAAQMPRAVPPRSGSWLSEVVLGNVRRGESPELTSLVNLQGVLLSKACRRSDPQAAIRHARTGARLCWVMGHGGLPRRVEVAAALDSLLIAVREETLAGRLTGAHSAAMLAALDAGDPEADMALTGSLEQLSLNELAEAFARKSAGLSDRMIMKALASCELEKHEDLAKIVSEGIGRDRTGPAMNTIGTALSAFVCAPRPVRIQMKRYFDVREYGTTLDCERDFIARFLTESFSAVEGWMNAIDAMRSRRDAVRIMLAIESFRGAAGGKPPASLDELVPGHISAVPIDAVNGKPFAYRTLGPADGDPLKRDYVLYSLGTDGTDNGGREVADRGSEAEALITDARTGVDYVFNVPGRR